MVSSAPRYAAVRHRARSRKVLPFALGPARGTATLTGSVLSSGHPGSGDRRLGVPSLAQQVLRIRGTTTAA